MVNGEKQFEHIDQGDVVILPAFGATIQVRTFYFHCLFHEPGCCTRRSHLVDIRATRELFISRNLSVCGGWTS